MDPETIQPPPVSYVEREIKAEASSTPSVGYVEQENGHSMPNLEEAKTEAAIQDALPPNNKYSGRNKRLALLVSACLVVVTLIVGFSVAISQNAKASKSSNADLGPSDFKLREVSRLEVVQEYLGLDISDPSTFDDRDTPQYRASLWIADADEAFLDVPSDDDARDYEASFAFVQRYIMAVFYYSLDGPFWSEQTRFLSMSSVCDWNFGLTADDPQTGAEQANWRYGVQCNTAGAVSHIFMTNNGLKGSLPKEMGDLLDLNHLSLFKNNIEGGFPDRMSFLTDMKFLAVESCGLSGRVPTWLNKWTSLEYLALGDNALTGQLPSFEGMDSLVEVAFDYNMLTGTVDALNDASGLKSVFLNDNQFTGRIHSSTFTNLQHLHTVDMSTNMLTGYFPAHWYYLRSIDLHNNDLSESHLKEFDGTSSPLTFLCLYNNNIPGSIPESINGLDQLQHLDLSENKLTGTITDALGELINLKSLYLANNPFTEGGIPHIRDLDKLEELSLTGTNRNGNIHSWLAAGLRSLVLLDLHDNALTGTIPVDIGMLQNLKLLFLNRNMLNGDIPDSLGDLPELVSVFLDNNELTGDLQAVCDAEPKNLAYLVADCIFEVTCPTGCCSMCCQRSDSNCNNDLQLDRLNDQEVRDQYLFSEDLIFRNSDL